MAVWTIEHHPDRDGRGWRVVYSTDRGAAYAKHAFERWRARYMPKDDEPQDAGTLALIDPAGRPVQWCGARAPGSLDGVDDVVDFKTAPRARRDKFPRDAP